MASSYRNVSRAQMTSRSGRSLSFEKLRTLLDHLDAYGLDLVSVTIVGDELSVTLSGDVPAAELEHLGLEKVVA